ncbi:MAG: glycosyltransferase [Candidatus Omnitrophica bacterium]|nr:glycosyltransferase [Candidatus Omnitrophota bacterium]MBU4488702.1 glycosyltransferase [Candidatus Omnitrophota bacterium]MCG2705731.1 glycosyltransferase [Candidatus Omnitrophota bacterium]
MSNKIKILIVSPYSLFPVHSGGKIRIFEIARNLSEYDFEVTVIDPFIKIRKRSTIVINDRLRICSVNYPLSSIFALCAYRFLPFQYIVSFHPGYRFFIREYLRAFDIYQFEHASFADLLDHLPSQKIVIYDAHNVEYDYVKSECRTAFANKLALNRIYDLEKKLILRSAGIFTCSEEDKNRFVALYGAEKDKISVIPNGVKQVSNHSGIEDDIIKKFPRLSQFDRRILFSGSDVEHNRVAVRFILDKLASQLKRECAFIIKGTCGKRFKKYKIDNVFINADGGDIKSYAAVSTAAINPVTQGGGTSLKVLDYLTYNLPVVSTEFGMRGYGDLKPFVTVSSLNRFADAILKTRYLSSEVTEVLKGYLWSSSTSKIKDIYLLLKEKVANGEQAVY